MPESTKIKQEAPDAMPEMSDDDLMPADLVMADDPDEIRIDAATIAASRHKLTNTLTFSFPAGDLKSALANIKADIEDPLSQSCFAQIRLDRGPPEFDDDELTNLDWLQDKHLARKISGNRRLCPSPPSSDDNMSDLEYDSGKENSSLNNSFTNSPMPHPTHIPYNPQKHINSKPPYSFSCLIFMAIEDCPEKKLPVKDIYSWIVSNFPYFQRAPTGWKNSVRHNLSLNKCFRKVDKDKSSNIGKGSYWCIDPNYRPNLLQALRKTPYHPYHQLQMMSSPSSTQSVNNCYSPYPVKFGSPSNISPHLFPLLNKRLKDQSPSSLDTDIDVANALVSLKKSASDRSYRRRRLRALRLGRRSPSPPEFGSTADKERTTRRSRRAHSPIIVTNAPSADHSYSSHSVPRALQNIQMSSDDDSSIDEEFEFTSGDEFDSDEEMHVERDAKEAPVIDAGKEMEGVNALLNLASIATQVMSEVVGDTEKPENKSPLTRSKTRAKKK